MFIQTRNTSSRPPTTKGPIRQHLTIQMQQRHRPRDRPVLLTRCVPRPAGEYGTGDGELRAEERILIFRTE